MSEKLPPVQPGTQVWPGTEVRPGGAGPQTGPARPGAAQPGEARQPGVPSQPGVAAGTIGGRRSRRRPGELPPRPEQPGALPTGAPPAPPLPVESLRQAVAAGEIDTVVLALPDLQGRLQGKRFHAGFFIEEVLSAGTDVCDYLLATDVEMSTVGGYALASWDRGYGDLALTPDLATLRRTPWEPGTALVLADVAHPGGDAVAVAPRQVLRHQLDRLAARGWRAQAATELEFLLFREPYEEAQRRSYRDLTPANLYDVDYSILGTARVEPVLRRIRNEMAGAGLVVESAKGECNLGQHEIAFRYADALVTADNHTSYKTGAKEIAAQEGMSLTFMAKFDEREGNSCHVHLSLIDEQGWPVFAAADGGPSPAFEAFLAGQLASLGELTLLFAPNVNSYKRFTPGSFAPSSITWGFDNRTCALRVIGRGRSLRMEHRVPGGDVNPYLGLAAIVAAGLRGVDDALPLSPPEPGNAYRLSAPRIPGSLAEAADRFEASTFAREVFGDAVVEHYVHAACVELSSYGASVTDWERVRGFERL
jgi:glutamine synthetase